MNLSRGDPLMTPEQQQALQEYIQAIAEILDDDTPSEQLRSLAGIEQAVRSQMQQTCDPRSGCFFIETTTGTSAG